MVLEVVNHNADRHNRPADHCDTAGNTQNERILYSYSVTSRKEIVVIIVHVCEIILSTGLAAERLTVAQLLEIV